MVSCNEFRCYHQCHNILEELVSVTLSPTVVAVSVYVKGSWYPLTNIFIGTNANKSRKRETQHVTFHLML